MHNCAWPALADSFEMITFPYCKTGWLWPRLWLLQSFWNLHTHQWQTTSMLSVPLKHAKGIHHFEYNTCIQSDKKTSVPALFWSRICSWTKYVCTLVSVNHVAVQQAYLDVETNSTLNRTVQPIIVKLCSGINTAESTQQNQHSGSWVHKSKRTHAPLSPDALSLTDTDSSD